MLTAKEKRTKKENCSNNNIIIKKTESKSKGRAGLLWKKQIKICCFLSSYLGVIHIRFLFIHHRYHS
jgi:hypothetical protein